MDNNEHAELICRYCGNKLNEARYAIKNGHLFKSCPKCSSQNEGECAFYPCPSKFGYRHNIIQSYCGKCRSNSSTKSESIVPCSILQSRGRIIKKVQLLPMNQESLAGDDLDHFFNNTLPKRNFKYYYKLSKISNPVNTLVLIQYKGKIQGYSLILNATDEVIEDHGIEYMGFYTLDPTNTQLTKQISLDVIQKYCPEIKSFNQSPQKIELNALPHLFDIFHSENSIKKSTPNEQLPEEIPDDITYHEGAKRTVIINAYERDANARKACIEHYRGMHNGEIICEAEIFGQSRYFDGMNS